MLQKKQKVHCKNYTKQKTYETTKLRTHNSLPAKTVVYQQKGSKVSVKKTGSGFTVIKQLQHAIKTEKPF